MIAVSRNFKGNVYEGLQQRICTMFRLSRARLSAKTEFILIEQLSDVSSEPKFTIGLNERIN